MPEIETSRRVIDPNDCDILGHRNVNSYFVMCSDGGFGLQAAFGLDRQDMTKGLRASFAVVHADSDFRREVLAGDIIYQYSGVVEIGSKSALFLHRQYRVSDDALVFQSKFRVVLMNLETRRAMDIPASLRTRMQDYFYKDP